MGAGVARGARQSTARRLQAASEVVFLLVHLRRADRQASGRGCSRSTPRATSSRRRADTPFFQIGEHKYGKPILDRVADRGMSLGQAGKLVLLSFDSTLRSNLSVGMPIDMLLYARDSLAADGIRRIDKDDAYFKKLSSEWSRALRTAFAAIDEVDH